MRATTRWVQVSGPSIAAPQQQGTYYSFIPSAPGTSRFVLIVAAAGEVPEPDEVVVLVGAPPGGASPEAGPPAMAAPFPAPFAAPPPASPPPAASPDQILDRTQPHLPESPRVASDVADVLESIAGRTALNSSSWSLPSELSRRLDNVVPADQAQRASWIQGGFLPLTACTAGELLALGLDIRFSQGIQQPLTPVQQDRVRASRAASAPGRGARVQEEATARFNPTVGTIPI